MLKFCSLILLSILINSICFSQDKYIRGKIFDKETNEALSFSTVEIFSAKTGIIANDSGFFELPINKQYLNDTIEVSCLGYHSKRIEINHFSTEKINIIYLEKRIFKLSEIRIKPSKYTLKKIGIKEKKNKGNWHLGNPGDQHAILIKNPFNKTGSLKNVSFYITENGFPSAPFRVRIYSYDSIRNKPGQDLLNTNLIVSFNKKNKDWFTIDMSKYNIEFPKNGLFVAMEWIFTREDYYYLTNMKLKSGETKDVKCYGQTIGLTFKESEILYWRRYLGTNWYHMKYGNAMINADIEFSND